MGEWQWQSREAEAEPQNRRTAEPQALKGCSSPGPKTGEIGGRTGLGGQNNLQARLAESHFKPPARCSTSMEGMGCLGRGSHWSATNLPPPGFVQGRGQRWANDKTLSDTPLAGAERRRLTPL